MGFQTPIAFLIFNRPETTEQVFAAIRRVQPETLLVVADGPRPDSPGEDIRCAEVREIIEQVDWPCRVLKNYSATNLGCKQRVSSGLDWVFSEVEEAIVLEDDCLPHPSFFPFCEKLLKYYRNDERVMMIGGTNYLLDSLTVPESYVFSRYYPIWGWATWRRSWQHYDITMREWPRLKKECQINSFYSQGFMRTFMGNSFDAAYFNRINTWDIQWGYSCLFNNGLSIIPRVNLIANIGAVGTHSAESSPVNFMPVFDLDTAVLNHPCQVYPNLLYDTRFFAEFLKPNLATAAHKVKAFAKKRWHSLRDGIGVDRA